MEIQEFQKKLAELSQSANENGKVLKGDQIRSFFEGMNLDREQLLQIFRYLKARAFISRASLFPMRRRASL